jgi:hypothetical protein
LPHVVETSVVIAAPKSKVELFAAIRRDSRIEGLSIRALSASMGCIVGWFETP